MKPQEAFENIVNNDFQYASHEDVKIVAINIWHNDAFVPDVSQLTLQPARAAIYLIDRLMRYNCVSEQRQNALIEAIEFLMEKYDIRPDFSPSEDRAVDRAARRWGLKSDLRCLLKQVLKYQTRHYQYGEKNT